MFEALIILSLEREFVEEVIGSVFRFIGRLLVEIVFTAIFEVIFRFPGNIICKPFTKDGEEPNGFLVMISSILFWALVVALGYFAYLALSSDPNV
ncbi:hypothetical protein A3224_13005 [Microbulbifer thermotolerans]|uniref:Uncharacterized protein n=1 Tax=Microbulbifer thermotolerans TaxID=252514 RepID=A0A143HPF7_MICTH|nr:hypothetical protein A3224_13005 [Microbulbifer thermotolerans]